MKIKIIKKETCDNCLSIECAFVNTILKPEFYSLRTESTVCPVAYLVDKPTNIIERDNVLDSAKCINCGLCVKDCPNHNLSCEDYNYQVFSLDHLSEQQYNAIALNYLGKIFDFSANTNRNSSIDFDGYIQNKKTGFEAFVEVDYGNDSLESCRRLLCDFLIYKGDFNKKEDGVNHGLMVLKDYPKNGEIYDLIKSLKNFPKTSNKKIYIITFYVLRHIVLNNVTLDPPESFFLNLTDEKLESYSRRILDLLQISIK